MVLAWRTNLRPVVDAGFAYSAARANRPQRLDARQLSGTAQPVAGSPCAEDGWRLSPELCRVCGNSPLPPSLIPRRHKHR